MVSFTKLLLVIKSTIYPIIFKLEPNYTYIISKITLRSEIEFCQYLLSNGIHISSYYQTSLYSNDNIYANRPKLLKISM